MMKLQYASDLHLEFKENSELLSSTPLDVQADILILAGDITLLGKNKYYLNPFFDWCCEHFKETYIVPGNHEYYNGFELADTMIDFQMSIRPNVHYINNRSVLINDTEIFFSNLSGSTINSTFCVDLDRYIEQSGIDTWIYGHTHYNGGDDHIIGNTRLHSNQLGYVVTAKTRHSIQKV